MSRRATMPGAEELLRSTGSGATPSRLAPVTDLVSGADSAPAAAGGAGDAGELAGTGSPRRARTASARRPTGRERHEEKITVYVSHAELLDLEQVRLDLRAHHGLAVDRGRVVREALAVLLADFEAQGETSILVRRLRGR
jgi:hypothetical protein